MQNNTDQNPEKEKEVNDLHQATADKSQQSVDQEWQKAQEDSKDESPKEEDLQSKYTELEDQHKRLWADQQNMINRFNRERADIHKYAAANTLEAILPALDNFDFAKKSFNENMSFEEVMKSIDMLQEQLIMSLKSVGLEEIDTSGIFNPEFHEAVSNVPDPEKEEGSIIEVLKKGFKVKDKVLRVATVVVSSKG